MKRRRFLTLAAAFAGASLGGPRGAHAATWSGIALGASVSVTLYGPRDLTEPALAALPATLDQIEARFSLFRAGSDLVRLNATGRLAQPDPMFTALMAQVDQAYALSNAGFDPTVQPLWQALSMGRDPTVARARIGWPRVSHNARQITLDHGQALTLNGIAQGFATDLIRAQLAHAGAKSALVNIGEFAALGGPFKLGLSDPVHGPVGQRSLQNRAIATSSPTALSLGAHGANTHILGPKGQPPLWSSVSIECDSATLADALSTAACLMPRADLLALKSAAKLHRITTIAGNGRVETL